MWIHPSCVLGWDLFRADTLPGRVISETSRIRTLVVDHDLCALARVLSLLKQEADIELVGECSTGPHALSLVDDLKPNLVFLEAGMPGLDGLEFARSLAITC